MAASTSSSAIKPRSFTIFSATVVTRSTLFQTPKWPTSSTSRDEPFALTLPNIRQVVYDAYTATGAFTSNDTLFELLLSERCTPSMVRGRAGLPCIRIGGRAELGDAQGPRGGSAKQPDGGRAGFAPFIQRPLLFSPLARGECIGGRRHLRQFDVLGGSGFCANRRYSPDWTLRAPHGNRQMTVPGSIYGLRTE